MTRTIQSRFAALLVLLCGIGFHQPIQASSGVLKSGYLGYPALSTMPSVHWLDDARVLFIGGKKDEVEELPDGRRPYRRWLMEWNTATGDVRLLSPMGETSRLCYDRGYVRYWHIAAGKQIVKSGLLGSEARTESDVRLEEQRRDIQLNWFSCKEYDRASFAKGFGERSSPLREEHGYWKGHPQGSPQAGITYVSLLNGAPREIVTPITGSFFVHWSEYAQSYVFLQRRSSYSESDPSPGRLWLMRPTGETSSLEIPFGKWLRGGHGVRVTRPGLLVWSHNVLDRAAAGYLVKDGRVSKLVDGYVHNVAVAPSSCRVAMSIEFSSLGRANTEMVALDVCARDAG